MLANMKALISITIVIFLPLQRRGGESSRTPPRSRDVSPLTVPSPRARSASPRTMADKNSASTTKLSSHPGKVNTDTKEVGPCIPSLVSHTYIYAS